MSTRCQIEFYDANPTDGAEPQARIYKHSDGYPIGILPMLKYIEGILKKDNRPYGPRLDDPEWAAAEFVTQFRLPSNWPEVPGRIGGEPLFNGTGKSPLSRYRGNIYVTQQIHQDIEYLYRVECRPDKWVIRVFGPAYDSKHDINGFHEVQ
jgi:hypothetical protein